MVFVKCPKCGRTFGAQSVPEDGLARCPHCNQALHLRPRGTPALPYKRPSIFRRFRPSRTAIVFGVLVIILMVTYRLGKRMRPGQAEAPGQPATSTAPASSQSSGGKTAFQSQRELARSAGMPSAMAPHELFATASAAVVRIIVRNADREPIGQGSGFLISRDGWVVTNYHVVRAGHSASLILEDYSELPVLGIGAVDRQGDLALLKVAGRNLPCLLVSSGLPPRVGTKVYAIGSPRGLANTLSDGLISGHRMENGLSVLQTTAAMSHGSSGGPLLTPEGQVIGVNSRIRAGGQNLNFAIPAQRIHDLLQRQGALMSLASLSGRGMSKDALSQLDRAWLAMDDQRWDEAKSLLGHLAIAHPHSSHVWFALGHYNRRTGLYKMAVEAFEAALRLKPDLAEAYYGIGITYLDQRGLAEILREHHRTQELSQRAKDALTKAADMDPAGKVGRAARAALRHNWPREYSKELDKPDKPPRP